MMRWVASAALCVGLTWNGGAAAAVFLDRAAYLGAVGQLVVDQGLTVRAVPISVRPIRFVDGFGEFTDPTILMRVGIWGSPYAPPVEYAQMPRNRITDTRTGPGFFGTNLGCHVATFPCFGAWSITFSFDRPVLGLGGHLHYKLGEFGPVDGGVVPIPFFEAPFRAVQEADPLTRFHRVYDGFFGMVAPMTEFTLDFRVGQNSADLAEVWFSGDMLVTAVPEPGGLALLAGALGLFGFVASAAGRRSLSPSAGSR